MGNAPKDVVERLRTAVAAVDEAKVPKDLRVAAFTAVLAGLPIRPPQNDPKGSDGIRPGGDVQPRGDTSKGLGQIADKLEIGEAQAGIVYDVDEDGVHVTVKRASLNKTKKLAQQEVTYLVVAGRQATGLEEWTPTKVAIETTHDRGVHDTNVSKAISALDGDGIRFRGTGSKREIKMNAVGFAKAGEIVKRLAEAS
ncbi:MAG TPA: hypothetical protein VFU11_04155 [Solirubrobacterales bacterium]|nr:hypothetical protein [Solirubrobacterales bacterium]